MKELNRGHGADMERYSWTQTLEEVTVVVPVGRKVKGKECKVDVQRRSIRISVPSAVEENERVTVLEGELFAPVRVDDCVWNVLDSDTVEVMLTKEDRMQWWKCVVVGEEEVDTQKIEPEPSGLGDLDPEMRSMVEKMMVDGQQRG
mmetsp:Transcript_12409/g.24970  ORF Transcript_12409/g.24970 Transcript_12409/m.24970 type:complete len:146 (+) Transcript_12409:149-586(+)|eukprot:jgi/Picre1/33885/NNA_001364.t1